MTAREQPVEILGDGLRLEGMLREGHGALAAVVMHPHPQYGGDMDNHVVLALCDAVWQAGGSTLRFNTRGTGRSEGAYDGGQGETDDARAALTYMRGRRPDASMVLAGYSFGAFVAARAGSTELAGLILVSPPLGMAPFPALPPLLDTLVVTGDRDTIAPANAVRSLASDLVSTEVVPGADHGWWPGVEELSRVVTTFVSSLGQQRAV